MSGNTSRRRGRQRELDYIAHLISLGWEAFRVDGAGDIVAGKDGITLLIQMKSTLTPWAHFGPQDRARLREAADRAGWIAVLVWWPKGRGVSKAKPIFEWDWPGSLPMPVLIDTDLLAA